MEKEMEGLQENEAIQGFPTEDVEWLEDALEPQKRKQQDVKRYVKLSRDGFNTAIVKDDSLARSNF